MRPGGVVNDTMTTPHQEHFLTPDEERMLLRIARETLVARVTEGRTLPLERYALTPTWLERHGAFVTLTVDGALRGCVGYATNRAPLAETVRDNTINACSRDSRFAPIVASELPDVEIEISAMTPGDSPDAPFRKIHDLSEIVLGRDGLWIESASGRKGLLLPQVPEHYGWDLNQFLDALCRKAGLAPCSWNQPDVKLSRFSAQVFSESESE